MLAQTGKGKANAPGQQGKSGATTTGKGKSGGATSTGKGKGGAKACTTVGCLACNPGGKCKQCDTANKFGLQGTRCVVCDKATMTLTAKGRCECM